MTNQGSYDLIECRNELRSIINQLRNIENGVRYDFKNVGNVRCADSIRSVIIKYERALATLNSINISQIDNMISESQES